MEDEQKHPFDHGMFPTKWPKELVHAEKADKDSRFRWSVVAAHAFIEQVDDQAILECVTDGLAKFRAEAARIYFVQKFQLEDLDRMFEIIKRRAEQIQRDAHRNAGRLARRQAQQRNLDHNRVTLH
jgi:hypothetical protein